MRSSFVVSILVLAMFFLSPVSHSKELAIGYTNVELVLTYMPETRQMEQNLQTYEKTLQQKYQVKNDYYQAKLMEYYEKQQSNGLSPAEDQVRREELVRLEDEIKQFGADSEQQLVAKRTELLAPILEKLQRAIDDVAQEKGYDYVFNQLSSGTSLILYGPKEKDITEDLMKKLGIAVP